ncbi:MAG: MBL fold metallo-hydrolase [Candidatus Bathyarchaeia archaeon]
MKIADAVWQMKIPMRHNPLRHTYSYLLSDAATLIDTGVGTGAARIALDEQLKAAGLNASDIEQVILTHLHRDHVVLAEYLRSKSGAEIYAHEKAIEVLKKRAVDDKARYDEARDELKALGGGQLLNVLSRFEHAFRRRRSSIHIDGTVSDGGLLGMNGAELRVIWTPGHAPEHICLHDEERRLLFSGDHVLPRITSHIGLHTYEAADPLSDYLNSLEKLKNLPVDLVLPAHEYTFRDLGGRIDALKHHHRMRCMEIMGALDGWRTVFQVSAYVSWDSVPWNRMRFWTKRMAAAETLAHLVYLRNRGAVEERDIDGVLYYRRADKDTGALRDS